MLALQQAAQYKRHRPETTLLYQLVEQYYLAFKQALAEQDKRLPKYVEREFDDFLRCGRLEHGFMRVFVRGGPPPTSNLRSQVTASQPLLHREEENSHKLKNKEDNQSDKPNYARSLSCALRLRRVFNIDIAECEKCLLHNVKVIACITANHVI